MVSSARWPIRRPLRRRAPPPKPPYARNLGDPAALARSTALPAGHPLRNAAEALSKAFEAVTSGPVEDAKLALPEISRRSPLAAWKPLVRAIACFYRRDDAGCEEHLRAIDAEAAPARLVPCLRAMMAGDARKVAARLRLPRPPPPWPPAFPAHSKGFAGR